MRRNFIFLTLALIASTGCSTVESWFDDVRLVYVSGEKMIPGAPEGFAVEFIEVCSLVPVSKVGFRLYVDREFYYLREEVDVIGVTRLAKTNSRYAEKYGLRINGRSRDEFEFLKALRDAQPGISLSEMSSALEQRKKGRPNQALQTTPMTRSVYGKTIEFGHPQRGV